MSIVLAALISIHLHNLSSAPATTIEQARKTFTQIYARIGVEVAWTDDPSALALIVRDEEPGELRRARHPVLGAAIRTAHGRPVAYVFYRRAHDEADRYATPVSVVLAGAMAHEVGHLMLPTRDHARDGLMRGCWDYEEFWQASAGQLRFSPTDAAAIRERLVR